MVDSCYVHIYTMYYMYERKALHDNLSVTYSTMVVITETINFLMAKVGLSTLAMYMYKVPL